MKTNKAAPAKRARSKTSHKKRPSSRTRSLHKRVLLHPFSVMALLCAGVLIVGSTITGYAANYDVIATVPASLPGSPAVMSDPIDGRHVTAQPITVSGSCPANSYVTLYRNGAFSGVAQCGGGLFQIQTSLSVGANVLNPKVFNVTNQEGPAGTPVTVYYDEVTAPSPLPEPTGSPPTALTISTLEQNNYGSGDIAPVSINPTITGYAPPHSAITLTFHSDVVYCRTVADATGFWSCTLDEALPIGVHNVEVAAVTPAGKRLTFPIFQLRVMQGVVSLKKPAPISPFVIAGNYVYAVKRVDQTFSFALGIKGGTAPYHITVDWGDGIDAGLMPGEPAFTISHAYTTPGQYVVLVRGTDAGKQIALLQLSAVVKGSSYLVSGAGWISRTLSGIKQWLWLVWPVYIGVLLMVLSYWVGEQEAYRELMARRRTAHSGKGKR